jgi:chromosomal replication initiator protein
MTSAMDDREDLFAAGLASGDPPPSARCDEMPARTGGTNNAEVDRMTAEKPNADQWSRVTQRLKAELGEDIFNSWFGRVSFEEADSGTVYLSVPTRFLKSWILAHYEEKLLGLWQAEQKSVVRVELLVRGAVRGKGPLRIEKAEAPPPPPAARAAPQAPAATAVPPLNKPRRAEPEGALAGSRVEPRVTFETFVEGSANRVAYAAARAVAEAAPGKPSQFNPLYNHAGVGRGKTHLLHATTRAARLAQPGRKVLYLTAEHFMFRFVAALRAQTAIAFKESLRDIDLLLIDDMQFLQGKSVQQEFCHMLNALIDGARQVVVAADRPPAELESLDERVRSRLRGGVAFEIGAPDTALRREILTARYAVAQGQNPGLDVPDTILEYVAQQVTSNGRDIEGALNRLVAQWQFTRQPVTIVSAEITLRDLVGAREPRRVKIEDIQRVVARHYNVSKADLLSSRRTRTIVRPRQIAMYLAKVLTPRSLPEIGRRFGGRDHTTVLHAVRKIEGLISGDTTLADEIELLKRIMSDE